MLTKVISKIRIWWKRINMSSDELYLSQSSDIVELENRLRSLVNSNHSSMYQYHMHIGGLR